MQKKKTIALYYFLSKIIKKNKGIEMKLICLDLEGVLIPEIWINFAKKTGIEELKLTTRDIPDYDELMTKRLGILKDNNLKLSDIQEVIAEMNPLDGALDFLEEVKSKAQLIILSDTFEEFAKPLMKKLKWPTLFCNSLVIGNDGSIENYILRQQDGKRKAVLALQSINGKVFAAGDSYNDVTMIQTANSGAFFCAPDAFSTEFPEYKNYTDYKGLVGAIEDFLSE